MTTPPGRRPPGRWALALWRGQVPLRRAFWVCALLHGTAANLVASLAFLGAVSAGWPDWLAVALFLAPTPYYFVAVVGVWRSAEAPGTAPAFALAARTLVLTWAVLMVVV